MPANLYEGSCLCEGVSFSMTANPSAINTCFCRDCQKNAGGPFTVNAEWTEEVMSINDPGKQVDNYIVTNTYSGRPKIKCFCKTCGCTLWTLWERNGLTYRNVRVGLIENGLERLQPTAEYFVKHRPAYIPPFAGAIQYTEDEPEAV